MAGRLFRNPALAATYRRVLAEAGDGTRDGQIERARTCWYEGFVAAAIDRFCRREQVLDASGRRHGGLLTGDDMARWRVPVETPLRFDYRGWSVVKGGPWSQGPVLLQTLALLQGFDLDGLDPLGPDFVHTVVECLKLALADREAWYGDPDFVDVPIETLLSPPYNDARRRLVGDRASLELRPGSPDGRTPRVLARGHEAAITGAGIGEPTVAGVGEPTTSRQGVVAGDTCHLDVVDRWGNMVSATPSGGWLQSSPVIPELGFCLGTRMQMLWLEEGLPASLEPGKRPRSTLSPSMAFKDGAPYMAFGTPGGDQQDQWSALMFLHHVHHRMNLQEAIECPAFHTEHQPSSFYPRAAKPGLVALEGRFPDATRAALAERGHRLAVGGPWSEGRLSGCAREETEDGMVIKAAANPRGMQGYAIGDDNDAENYRSCDLLRGRDILENLTIRKKFTHNRAYATCALSHIGCYVKSTRTPVTCKPGTTRYKRPPCGGLFVARKLRASGLQCLSNVMRLATSSTLRARSSSSQGCRFPQRTQHFVDFDGDANKAVAGMVTVESTSPCGVCGTTLKSSSVFSRVLSPIGGGPMP